MADETKSKEKKINSTKITKKLNSIKKPPTSYFRFCKKIRNEMKNKNPEKKLTAKELGKMWKELSPEKKKIYRTEYEEEKKKYDKLKSELESKSDSNSEIQDSKDNKKKKTKPKKSEIIKNNKKTCNCGKCAECQKRKNKNKRKDSEELDIKDDSYE